MFYVGLIVVCLLMFALFLGVTIAGGRAHDRQNRENAEKAARLRGGRNDARVD